MFNGAAHKTFALLPRMMFAILTEHRLLSSHENEHARVCVHLL